jgi:PKD repeat protein
LSTTSPCIRPAAVRGALAALAAVALLGLAPGGAAAAVSGDFTFTPAAPKTGNAVAFGATATPDPGQVVTDFSWTFGDGGTGSGANPSHTYGAAGTYTVTLTITEDVVPPGASAPSSATVAHTVTVRDNVAPTASFTVTPLVPNTGRRVTFRSTSTDPDGTIASQTWDLDGDGTFGDSTRATASTTFRTPGPHPVSLRVTDNDDAQSAIATTVVNVNALPAVGFTFTPVNPLPGTGVTFTSTSTDIDGTITSWAWDLDGDGNFKDASTPVAAFTFLTAGAHTVGLRVTDNLGATATLRQTVTVDQPPVASFSFTPKAPLVGQPVTFTSTSTDADGSIVSQEWDLTGTGLFNDATGKSATRVFTQSGDAIVRLRVTDNRGVSVIAAVTVPVGGPPIASFDVSPNPTAGRGVTLTSTSRDIDGAIVSWQWDLNGDGVFGDAAGAVVTQTYPSPGTYTVGLRVTDTTGLTGIAFHSIVVHAPPPPPRPVRPAVAAPARLVQPILPFPLVRVAGSVSGRSTRITLLEVRAPAGSRIRVKCHGRGCVRRDLTAVGGSRPVRFRKMRRTLRAGAAIEVFVRANGRIGKYTRFRIRRNRPPLRTDLCLPPTTRAPARCT